MCCFTRATCSTCRSALPKLDKATLLTWWRLSHADHFSMPCTPLAHLLTSLVRACFCTQCPDLSSGTGSSACHAHHQAFHGAEDMRHGGRRRCGLPTAPTRCCGGRTSRPATGRCPRCWACPASPSRPRSRCALVCYSTRPSRLFKCPASPSRSRSRCARIPAAPGLCLASPLVQCWTAGWKASQKRSQLQLCMVHDHAATAHGRCMPPRTPCPHMRGVA